MTKSKCLIWLFGRGASVACGLTWTEPNQWHNLPRNNRIEMIKSTIKKEMNAPHIHTMPYKSLLARLKDTTDHWHHRFVTTNWDYLLQREIDEMGFSVAPRWLPETGVYHLNGSVEDFGAHNYRTDILLETDLSSMRRNRPESNVAFNHVLWATHFIIIGMSFSCKMDRSFFYAISHHQDNLPICNSSWLIMNRTQESLDMVKSQILNAIPCARVSVLNADFAEWVNGPMKELQVIGVLNTSRF